jgi:hypothetical protein
MKHHIIIFLIFCASNLLAQQSEIKGVVSIHNSKFETGKTAYLSNVQIKETYGRGQEVLSNSDGRFTFTSIGVPLKETIVLNAQKQGWEVVNPEELDVVVGQFPWVKVYMAPKGKITENKRKYYNIGKTESEKALSSKIKEKQSERERLLKDVMSNQKEIWALEAEIKNLYEKYQTIDANARELAERFSRVNLDDASEHYQRAFRHFQNGKIDSALIVLEDANYAKQVDEILLEEIRLAALKNVILHNDSVIVARKDSLLNAFFLKVQAHEDLQQFQEGIQACKYLLQLPLADTATAVKALQKLSWLSLLVYSFGDAEQFAQLGLTLQQNDPALNRYWALSNFLQDKHDEKAIVKTLTIYPLPAEELSKLEKTNLPQPKIKKLSEFVRDK